jgi:thiamine transport system permease protein
VDDDRPVVNRLPRSVVAALAAAPLVFLAVFYLWPASTILVRGLRPATVADVLSDARTWRVAWFTCWQAVVSTAVTLVAGVLPAYVVARFRFPGRAVLLGLLTAAFVLPTVVMAAAILALLPDSLERSTVAIVAAHVVFNLAVVVRTVGTTWEQLPVELEHAATTLGASPIQVFRHVTLPLLRPSIHAAAGIVFLFTFTSFGVIRLLGTARRTTIEVEIWRRATQLGEIGPAAVLSLLQVVALGAVVAWSAAGRRRAPSLDLRGTKRRARPRGRRQRCLVTVTATATALVVLVPLAALVERSLRTPEGYSLAAWTGLGDLEVRPGIRLGVDPLGALRRSLETAAWATGIAVVLGGLAALAVTASGRAGRVLDAGLVLPLGTSAVTIGFGMLVTFDQPPVDWRDQWWLVPVGHALIAVPFVVRAALGVLRSIDPDLVHAAATLGASPTRAWREVVVPHLWRPLVVGAGLAAAISLGEFGATSFLSRSGAETVPIAIERLLGRTGTQLQAQGYVLATILAAATIAIVAAIETSPVAASTFRASTREREHARGR